MAWIVLCLDLRTENKDMADQVAIAGPAEMETTRVEPVGVDDHHLSRAGEHHGGVGGLGGCGKTET